MRFYSEPNCVPPKDMTKFSPLAPVNVTLFGKRVFADVSEVKSPWIGWALNPMKEVLRIDQKRTQRHGRERALGKPRQGFERCSCEPPTLHLAMGLSTSFRNSIEV